MAKAAKPAQHPEAKRVVELVMERLGAKNDEDLARELHMPPYNKGAMRKIQRWIAGVNAPSFKDLMLMLSEAGLLDPVAVAAWKGEPLPAMSPEGGEEETRQRRVG